MIDTFITSKTRIRLLLKFFLNPGNGTYLRAPAAEFEESTNAIRLELNRFEEAVMLKSVAKENRKIFQADSDHSLYPEARNISLKYIGIYQAIHQVISKTGSG